MHNQNKWLNCVELRTWIVENKKYLCMWLSVQNPCKNQVSTLFKPRGTRHPLLSPPPRAVDNLSTSLFVKEYFA